MEGTILLVDDNHETCQALEACLELRGLLVIPYTDASKAMDYIRENTSLYDIGIFDHALDGGYSGIELLRESKNVRPDVPVMIMSGHPVAPLEAEIFIAKPFNIDQLVTLIDSLLQKVARQRPKQF